MYITVDYIQLIQNVTINHLRNPRVFSPLLSKQIWKATRSKDQETVAGNSLDSPKPRERMEYAPLGVKILHYS